MRLLTRWLLVLPGLMLMSACTGSEVRDPSRPPAAGSSATPVATGAPVTGPQTFVIVPEQSKASYHANEEFFPGAFRLLGIEAGKVSVVGSTQAIEGRFQFDPGRADSLEAATFTVRVNTLTSDRTKRDDYVREIRDDGGPSFDAYPLATFRATALDGDLQALAAGGEMAATLLGDLTVRDVTKPVAFLVKVRLAGDTMTGVGTTRLLLSDFGIGPIEFYDVLTVADEVRLEVQFTARAQPR